MVLWPTESLKQGSEMTYREDAPRPRGDESPGQYLNRLAAYYNEPDRRRMGSESRAYLEQAVVAMDTPVEPLLTLLGASGFVRSHVSGLVTIAVYFSALINSGI